MIQLLLNHSILVKEDIIRKEIFQQCILISKRIKVESENIYYIKSANTMEALAEMYLGNGQKVINLLDNKLTPYRGDDVILINAFKMQRKSDEANKVNQILLYNNIINTLTLLNNYLSLNITDFSLFEKIYSQAMEIIDSFKLTELYINDVFAIHIGAAQGYLINKNKKKALDALERYIKIACSIQFPLTFKGNEYFTHVGKWFEDNNFIGTNTPIDETTIKKNFFNVVVENPAFTALKEDERYKIFVEKLKGKLGEKNECNKCE